MMMRRDVGGLAIVPALTPERVLGSTAARSPVPATSAFDAFLPVGFPGFHNLSRVTERAPLTIEGLPSPAFYNYVQYESVTRTHNIGEAQWAYSGTNGFRSDMRATG